MSIGLLCGGPSLERGISLNSARSVLDHLGGDDIKIVPIYFDQQKRPYRISTAQLYSNTPSDFDFKLAQTAKPLNQRSLVRLLKKMDIVFPVIHGQFGEDGHLQAFLEKNDIPFIGSGSEACKKAFDKHISNEYIRAQGFFAPPSVVLKIYATDYKKIISVFFRKNRITRAVVKPAGGGSSIGVFSVSTPAEALEKVRLLFSKRMDTRVVIEPFAQGVEFTTIIFQNRFSQPVALIPTEIETDYARHQFFDFRKKYLPTRQVTYHCPPRFSNDVIEKIQIQAEQLFSLFGMRDFARFDGWVLNDGSIWFSDFNPMSGMEQNSFLFQQSSRIGFSHADTLRFILTRACQRYGIAIPVPIVASPATKKPIHILFGGRTSERQVSLMSGTNVWLKLRKSSVYEPQPFLLDLNNTVWKLPYAYALNHTVEEIAENCRHADQDRDRLEYLERKISLKLALRSGELSEVYVSPQQMSVADFMEQSAFVFIALHGGAGEDGTLQKELRSRDIVFNGPDERVSKLCMDKWATNQYIANMNIEGILPIPAKVLKVSDMKNADISALWNTLKKELDARTIIVKPRADGCSSGIVHLYTKKDLVIYLGMLAKKVSHIPPGTFSRQSAIIEMPLDPIDDFLFEKFIETDILRVQGNKLKYRKKSGWIEITVGVLEEVKKKSRGLRILNPSITVAEGDVLSVEEKFQGGTGVNITPPPEQLVKPNVLKKVKERIGVVAEKIGITGYCRIDAFMNIQTGALMIIEVNTLPGLTPSTVLYHQGLAENPQLFPKELLELLITNKDF